MSKNPKSARPVKGKDPMTGAMKFFLAGCVAELYLFIIRRFYVNGTAAQMVAWFDYLLYLAASGLVVFIVGLVLSVLWRADRKKRVWGWAICGAGAFLGGASGLVRLLNAPALSFLSVAVPVAMLLVILWSLYDRECSWALTILGVSLLVLWIMRRELNSMFLGSYVKAGAAVYFLLLVAVAFLARKASRSNGVLGKVHVLPAGADVLPVYVACGLSAVAVAAAFISTTVAYYAMWSLAVVVFALAVYYTVKQL